MSRRILNPFDQIVHRWIGVPYALYVRDDKRVPKPKATLVFLHGIGGSGEMWQSTIRKLKRDDVRVITLDLIGFGNSPKPVWAQYSAKFQARSLRLTLAKLFVTGKVVIIGHSLGSLVAIEAQHRYGYLAKALILCSPPLYRSEDHKAFFHPERALRKLYRVIHARPDDFLALSAFAIKYKLVNKSFFVTRANMEPFVNALQAAIVNQTAMDDVVKLRVPVEIIHGIVDPIVIAKNLRTVAKQSEYIHVTDIPAGHEIGTVYDIPLVATINRVVDNL